MTTFSRDRVLEYRLMAAIEKAFAIAQELRMNPVRSMALSIDYADGSSYGHSYKPDAVPSESRNG